MFPFTRHSCAYLLGSWATNQMVSCSKNKMRSLRKMGNLSHVSLLLELAPLKSIGGGPNVPNYCDQVSSMCKCLPLVKSTNDFFVVAFERFGVDCSANATRTRANFLPLAYGLFQVVNTSWIAACSTSTSNSLLTWMGPSKVKWTTKWPQSMFYDDVKE